MDVTQSSKSPSDWTEIDSSYRFPTLFLASKAVGWLLLGSIFSLIASIKMHSPSFLANCPWVTYGVMVPAALNAVVYGFALQGAFAGLLWITMRLGQVKLVAPGYLFIGSMLWNIGVLIGVVGIMAGHSTGHAYLEMPGYVSPILFAAYTLIGGIALVTFHKRQVRELYPSQWYIFAALYWFPWILTAGSYLLQISPVRGVTQSIIGGWYASGLNVIVLGFVGIAIFQYLLPKVTKRDLHNGDLSLFAFWMILFFGGVTGLLPGQSLPAWVGSLSAVCSVFVAFAWLILAYNIYRTLEGASSKSAGLAYKFVYFSAAAGLLSALLTAWASRASIAEVVQFTLFLSGLKWLHLYGFVGMGLLGCIYLFLPKVTGTDWSKPGQWNAIFWTYAIGTSLVAIAFLVGGWKHGKGLVNPETPFMDVLRGGIAPFIRMSSLGELLVLVAAALLCWNVSNMFCRTYCSCFCGVFSSKSKTASASETHKSQSKKSSKKK
jgi:cytochrome c oxidase cbb3-type subunit 1